MTQTNSKTELTLDIGSLSYGRFGIGRYAGKALMVPQTAPGDKITARVVESRDRYDVAEVVRILDPSPARRIPLCPYAGECGGCSWQHIEYRAQLEAKQRSVEDALRRIGKLDGFEVRPIIASDDEYRYRRRIRLQVDGRRRIGFYHASSHRLVEIASCAIAVESIQPCLAAIRAWVSRLRVALEYVELVAGDGEGEIVAVVDSPDGLSPHDENACRRLLEPEGLIRGLIVTARGARRAWGETRISVFIDNDLQLGVEADVFTQINPPGNRRVLKELLRFGQFADQDRVLELYCGAGNFTLSIAGRVREVVAVDGHRASVVSGQLSAQRNEIQNIQWRVSYVPAALERLVKQNQKFSRIVLDPPRAGAKGIDRFLAALRPDRIVYVSCNPATLARDTAALVKCGYKLSSIQPIDLFPQTFHVESLALLERQ